MTDQLQIEESILLRALEIPEEMDRAAFLDHICGDNSKMRAGMDELLRAHGKSGDLLDLPESFESSTEIAEQPGSLIGQYKLLEQIGEGGMGVVFLAEQERPIRRRVALKIIKPGMDTREVIGRFEAERQALAMMDHPNIAKVYDAGTTENGRPYFIMELVQGVPITEYCDQCNLTTRERLELFSSVCQAVQHAHQNGVIHRDLKPTNVLVTMQDGQPAPKIIDFGVAKAIGERLTEHTLMTAFAQMVGTPLYMSPEQAELSPLGVDTRSDIYSLGVLLYELLTSTTPFDKERLHTASFDEMRRIIREEEPPHPSARISTLALNQATTIAERHRTVPRRLVQTVLGELDWIVMKCLEKDRNRRYATANSLALDLERYLANEPVEACPPSATYRFLKFASRNKAALATAGIVAASLVLGTVVSIWQATLARRAEALAQARLESEQEAHQQATAEAIKATTVSELLQTMLGSANPSAAKGTDYTVRQMLDDFSADLGDQLRNQPEAEAAIRATIGNAYRGLQSFDKAEPHLKSALELRVRLFGPEHAEVAQSLIDYSANDFGRGDVVAAEKRAREALAIYRKLNLQDGTAMRVLSALQLYLVLQAKYEEAEQIAQEALGIARHHPGRYPEVATVLHNLAHAAVYQDDPVKAERFARQSVALHKRLHGEIHPETAHGLYVLATSLHDQQKFDEAEVHYRAALMIHRKEFNDSQTPVLAASAGLAHTLRAKGDQAGLDALRAMIDLSTSQPEEWESWYFRGTFFAELSDWEQADAAFAKAAELDSDPKQLNYLYYLALLRLARHDRAGYRELCSSLVKRAEKSEEPSSAFTAASACVLAPDSVSDPSQAVTLAQRAYESNLKKPDYLATLGAALYRAGRFDEAKKRFTEAIEATPSGPSDLYAVTYSHLFLAMALRRLGQPEEARQFLNQAVQVIDKTAPLGEQKVVEGWDSILPLQILRQEAEQVLADSKGGKHK